LAIPFNVVPILEHHLGTFVSSAPDSYVFTGKKDQPVSVASLTSAWKRAEMKIGRPEIRPHDHRHTGLTLAAALGATLAELMYRAGNSSPAAALRYQHTIKDRDRTLADAMAALEVADVTPSRRRLGTEPIREQNDG
jgi:integrase